MRRPPKKWFYAMIKRLRKQYPTYGARRLQKIAAGIWHKQYSPTVKGKLVRAAENPTKFNKFEMIKRIVKKISKWEPNEIAKFLKWVERRDDQE